MKVGHRVGDRGRVGVECVCVCVCEAGVRDGVE